jgi:hypothetical protein
VERIGEDYPEEDEAMLRDFWEDGTEKDTLLGLVKGEREVRPGRPLCF